MRTLYTPYCITCQKNLLHVMRDGDVDGIPNGEWTQAMATSHATRNPGHQVINGNIIQASTKGRTANQGWKNPGPSAGDKFNRNCGPRKP